MSWHSLPDAGALAAALPVARSCLFRAQRYAASSALHKGVAAMWQRSRPIGLARGRNFNEMRRSNVPAVGRQSMARMLTYAVGDIHGSYTKLANLLNHCIERIAATTPVRFVFVGDYVDRGRRSREVVSSLMKTQASRAGQRSSACAATTRTCCSAPPRTAERGGVARQRRRRDARKLRRRSARKRFPPSTSPGSRTCRSRSATSRRFFVHAGIRPGVPLQEQSKERDAVDPRAVPVGPARSRPVHRPWPHAGRDRIPRASAQPAQPRHRRLFGGPLTAAVFDETRSGPVAFITDDGAVAAGPPAIRDA